MRHFLAALLALTFVGTGEAYSQASFQNAPNSGYCKSLNRMIRDMAQCPKVRPATRPGTNARPK